MIEFEGATRYSYSIYVNKDLGNDATLLMIIGEGGADLTIENVAKLRDHLNSTLEGTRHYRNYNRGVHGKISS